jgi:protein phosphatase
MGGHEAGEVASSAAIAAFAPLAGREIVELEDVRAALSTAVAAVRSLSDAPDAGGAGTTISGVAVTRQNGDAYWLVINLGDSRTYLLSGGSLEQVSVDHSLVQELVESGELTAEGAGVDPRKNVITRAIGAGSAGEADYWFIPANSGDRLLVCSDGLTGELSDEHLLAALLQEHGAQDAATRLVHEALLHGGRDNVTVLVVDALSVGGGVGDDATSDLGALAGELTDDTLPRPSTDPVGRH